MPPIISVDQLCKDFHVTARRPGLRGAVVNLFAPQRKTVHAVADVHLTMQAGEMVGYLGPNGAGKSTTIKMLTGLLKPTSGEVTVNGRTPWKQREETVRRLGAVFGQRTTLWWDLPVMDSFELQQTLYDIPKERFRKNLNDFIELLEMGEFIYSPVRSLSLGQRMRADLCAALLHDPLLVLLDEPTIGLDVVAKERIRQFIGHIHRERGVTVLLTTHDLADVERLCQRVVILDHGRLLYDGALSALSERFEQEWSLEVTFNGEYADLTAPGLAAPERLAGGLRAVYRFDHRLVSSAEAIQRVLGQFQVQDIEVKRPPLEETIRRIYQERLLATEDPSILV